MDSDSFSRWETCMLLVPSLAHGLVTARFMSWRRSDAVVIYVLHLAMRRQALQEGSKVNSADVPYAPQVFS